MVEILNASKAGVAAVVTFVFLVQSSIAFGNVVTNSSDAEKEALAEVTQPLTRDDMLADKQARVSEEFKIPMGLKDRVGFWFDIYTNYDSTKHIIHHMDYPWVIYDVVDTSLILSGQGNRWTKYHRAEAEVRTRKSKVVRLLKKMAKYKSFSKLSADELKLFKAVESIPGKRRSVLKTASENLRAQLGQKDFIENGLSNFARYQPEMEKIFADKNLPTELLRLPLVESSFNEDAVSKVGASGIWQIMPSMGKKFLKMTGPIDERNSPLKATAAAAILLKQNFQILKSWPLAVTAYNHGPGGLLKAKKKLKTDDLNVFISKHDSKHFGFASSNFYCEFLAALHAEKYKTEIYNNISHAQSLAVESVPLSKTVRIKALIEASGLTFDDLQSLNPELKDNGIHASTMLPKGFRIFLPEGRRTVVEDYLKAEPKKSASKRKGIRVTFKEDAGQTL